MDNSKFEKEQSEMKPIIQKIWNLLEREIKQQTELNDLSNSALKELDDYLKTFEESDSILNVGVTLRSSFTAKRALKNWLPLLNYSIAKWPDESKDAFIGLTPDKW